MKCSLCEQEAVDSVDFEAGNNAEIGVAVRLCDSHCQEHDSTGYAFQEKYGSIIDRLAYEGLLRD